jgi:predicted transcriptional regulator
MKTIRQIADELGVSKQAIHQKIKKEPLSTKLTGLTSTVDGVVYISVDGVKLIKSEFSANRPSTVDVNEPSTVDGVVDGVDGNIVALLSENLAVLQGQLAEKDRQLAEKDKQLADVTAALVAAQQTAATAQALHAGTLQQQLTEKSAITDSSKADNEEKCTTNDVVSEYVAADERDGAPPKRGFFGVFKKKKG